MRVGECHKTSARLRDSTASLLTRAMHLRNAALADAIWLKGRAAMKLRSSASLRTRASFLGSCLSANF